MLQVDDSFKKTEKTKGLIEGTHFVREDEQELKYEVNTLMGLIMSMMEQAGTPMTDLAVIERIQQEKEEHEINKKLILIDKKLE